jgi:copper(I)-binding protein
MNRISRLNRLSRLASIIIVLASSVPVFGNATLAAQPATVTVHDAWVREPGGSRKVTAGFLVIENAGAAKRAIVSASTDAAETVELHEMVRDGAMMRMAPVKTIDVPANGKTELKPGGLHLMIFGLKKQPVAGDTIRFTLTLDDGTTTAVAAQVRKMGGMR